MAAFNQPGESWQDFAARSQAECARHNEVARAEPG